MATIATTPTAMPAVAPLLRPPPLSFDCIWGDCAEFVASVGKIVTVLTVPSAVTVWVMGFAAEVLVAAYLRVSISLVRWRDELEGNPSEWAAPAEEDQESYRRYCRRG